MTDQPSDGADTPRVQIAAFHDHAPPSTDFRAAFLSGISRPGKSLAGRMLIDRRSPTFRQMSELPEYYLVRSELEILRFYGGAIARAIGPAAQLIDMGSGFGVQMQTLLEVLDDPWGFVAIDRDREALLEDARRVQARYPRLWVEAVCADLRQIFDLPSNAGGGRRVAYMPGSAIGNLDPAASLTLLSSWAGELGPGGLMLVGVDLRKSKLIVEAAYDDGQGLHALLAFELLRRANRELDADFDTRLFEYRVQYDADHGRVSCHLVSIALQDIAVAGELHRFAENEAMHMEDSWKYSVEDFQALARGAGFRPTKLWLDAKGLFSLHLLEAS